MVWVNSKNKYKANMLTNVQKGGYPFVISDVTRDYLTNDLASNSWETFPRGFI